ncbi:hypothetical protein HDR65_00500 [bacterium]|nr:hypothetical protein [bacterium]
MKTRIAVFFLGLLMSASVQAILPPQYTSDLVAVTGKKHPGKLVLKYFAPIDKGFKVEIGEPIESVYVVNFNRERRPTTYWEYDLKGNLVEKYEVEYNVHGLLSLIRRKGDAELIRAYMQYIYGSPKDKKSLNETKIYGTDASKLISYETYVHDKKGNISAMKHLDAKGVEMFSYAYFYDISGMLESEIRQDAKGVRQSETRYDYDDEGKKRSETVFGANEKMLSRTTYHYNEKGLVDGVTMNDDSGKMERYYVEYEYDEYDNWIRQTVYKGTGYVPTSILIRLFVYED